MKRVNRIKLLTQLLCALVWSACALTGFAQSTASLHGTVTDQAGAVVPNVKVVVRNQATGVERTAMTDESGSYQVASLEPGAYRVEAQAQGFQTQVINDLNVEVARIQAQNFKLTIGNVSQQVTVTSETPVVETATTSVGTVINQRTVQEIPLNGRHFVDLGLLIPGSVTPPQNGFLSAPLRGQGSFAFNTAGNREDTVNFQINGVNLNDMVQNQITFQPSVNTVQEFKVDNSTFSAEYGRNSGAIVNIATRSGTNQFHGELFEFFRNDALDARNFFNFTSQKPPPFKRNQFGGNLGGPVRLPFYSGKDRTFFFFSYEGLRQRQGLDLNSGVLTDAQRLAVTDTISRRLLDLIPRANLIAANGQGRFVGSATAPVNIDQWTIDISHNLNDNDRLHGYYAFQRDFRGEPNLQLNTIPGFGDTRQSRRQIMTLNETHSFGPSLVNEARFGFNRIHITFTPNTQVNPADFGINDGISQPIGLPQIAIGGLGLNFGGPSNFPQGRSDTTYVLSDTLSYLRGKHSFKFGGEARRFYNNNFNLDTGTFTFFNLANFQTGLSTAATANSFNITLGDRASSIAQGALGLFVQDNYRARSNLTFELGLRYDWNMSPTERFNRFVNFDPATSSLVQVNHGIAPIYHTNAQNIQPRVGIAWDPFGDGKTSVRAAYAIMVDQPVTNVVTPVTGNSPLATPLNFNGVIGLGNARTVATAAGLAPQSVDQNFDNAYVQSWNLNIQREIAGGVGVTLGYFGSKGTHLRIARNINQFITLGGTTRPFPTLRAAPDPGLVGRALGNITQIESSGNSSYNALWATANKRLGRGLQFNASYTWSKSIDYNSLNSQGLVVQDSYNLRNSRGLSDYDARHRFVINGIYDLPFKGNRLAEGWQLGTIFQTQTGNPINVITNIATITGVATVRPDLIRPVTITGNPAQWFSNAQVCDPRITVATDPRNCANGAAFALPFSPAGVPHFGNLGRNVLIGPGFSNLDFSIIKNTKLTETSRLQFRAEFFDLLNHANFGQPNRTALTVAPGAAASAFGTITNTRFQTGDSGSSRQIQFAVKLLF
ncbi:MAG TPA: carboxypeptidase regulatory-like domain-containing protein [Pyrinomonadaceae bacterium]